MSWIKAGCGHSVYWSRSWPAQLPLFCVDCGIERIRKSGMEKTANALEQKIKKARAMRRRVVGAVLGFIIAVIVFVIWSFLRG